MLVRQHPCALRGVLGEYKLGVLKAEQDVRNGSVSAASSPVAYGLAGGKARERDGAPQSLGCRPCATEQYRTDPVVSPSASHPKRVQVRHGKSPE